MGGLGHSGLCLEFLGRALESLTRYLSPPVLGLQMGTA